MRDHALERVALTMLLGALTPSWLAYPVAQAQERSPPAPQNESLPAPETRSPAPSGETPVRVFTDAQGRSCRIYARDVVIEGSARTGYAIVCRESNGRWVLSR